MNWKEQLNLAEELKRFGLKATDRYWLIIPELDKWIRWLNDKPEEALKKLYGYIPKKAGGTAEHEIQGILFIKQQLRNKWL